MTSLRNYRPLRLIAENARELTLLSASLQDAVAKLGDFAYLPERRRFAFVANRFIWECAVDRNRGPFARVRAGAHFDDVLSVRKSNLREDAKESVVELLAVRFEEGEEGGGIVTLDFAGGGAIRLEVEAVNAALSDLTEPWRTRTKPKHEL